MKKIYTFLLALMVLVCSSVPVQAKAEEYLSIQEICDIYGITVSDTIDVSYNVLNSSYAYFILGKFGEHYFVSTFDTLQSESCFKCSSSYFYWCDASSKGLSNCGSVSGSKVLDDCTSNPKLYNGDMGYDESGIITVLYANFDICSFDYDTYNFQNYTFVFDLYDAGHVHDYVSYSEDATCTSDGKTWEECECGSIQNEIVVPALGHTWTSQQIVGSCIEDSKTWEECSVCGEIQNEVITPTSGHVWVSNELAATCTADGKTWEECGCGAIQNEVVISALGHTWVQYQLDATCTDDGKTWEECGCGAIQNEVVVAALGHTWVQHQIVGSCIEDSKTWDECSVCGEIKNEVIISALGHIYDDDSDDICNVCSYNRNIEKTVNFIDMIPVMLSLFTVFPLNVFLVLNFIVLSVIIYRDLKRGK